MHTPPINDFITAFSYYIESGDIDKIAPFLATNANPAYLKIYRNGVIKGCLDALASNFPTLKAYIGDARFTELARGYIQHHWPKDTRLSTYGEQLSSFIGNKSNNAVHAFPYSQDFATLDRGWLDALFAQDEQSLDGNDITAILTQESQQDLFSLQLAQSVKLMHLSHSCINHWLALKFSEPSSQTDNSSCSVLFWRFQQQVQYRMLSAFEEHFIRSMTSTASILAAAEMVITEHPNEDIGALFGALLTAGILVKPYNKEAEI